MKWLLQLSDIIFHLNIYLPIWANSYGGWIYALLFIIIFCETGLIVTPFLPGDSLLFAAGSVAALTQNEINIHVLVGLLWLAAILGDGINYYIGGKIGKRLTSTWKNRFIRPKYIDHTIYFYQKYGGVTLIIARFIPIVRTFAPFVAGIGQMRYIKFIAYNVVGASLWVLLFTYAGYLFGQVAFIQQNLLGLMFAIAVISLCPVVITFFYNMRYAKASNVIADDD